MKDASILNIFLDLLVQKFKRPLMIFDLTNVEENKLAKCALLTQFKEQFEKNNFDFLPKILKMESIDGLFISNEIVNYFPRELFENLTHIIDLNIGCRKYDRILENNFIYLQNLKYFQIYNSKLGTIEQNAFESLKNLNLLDIVENNINKLDPDIFNGLENLEYLNFDRNKIQIVRENTFVKLKSLIRIKLNQNKIKKIEKGAFSGLTRLEILELNNNESSMEIEHGALDACTALEILDLGYNLINKIDPAVVEGLKNLKFLNLRKNNFTDIKFVNLFKNLELLDLANMNTIVDLNSLDLPNLKFLLHQAEIMPQLGKNFSNLQALELYVHNKFSDKCFDNLTNLEYLKITTIFNRCVDDLNLSIFDKLKNLKYFSFEKPGEPQTKVYKFHVIERHLEQVFKGQTSHYAAYLPTVNLFFTEVSSFIFFFRIFFLKFFIG